jgi:hypothetical protein
MRIRTLAVATAMAAVALAPTAHADVYVGPYDVSNCTFSWGTGPTIQGTLSSQNCIDGFLVLLHDSHLVSHPTYAGSTSDHQLVDDGTVACFYYRRDGWGIDRTAAKVRQIDSSLSGGKTGDPASELVTEAIASLCEAGGLRIYEPGT